MNFGKLGATAIVKPLFTSHIHRLFPTDSYARKQRRTTRRCLVFRVSSHPRSVYRPPFLAVLAGGVADVFAEEDGHMFVVEEAGQAGDFL